MKSNPCKAFNLFNVYVATVVDMAYVVAVLN